MLSNAKLQSPPHVVSMTRIMMNLQMFSMSQLAVEIFNENPGAFGKVCLERTSSRIIYYVPVPKLLICYS
jgi:hypothetical protein